MGLCKNPHCGFSNFFVTRIKNLGQCQKETFIMNIFRYSCQALIRPTGDSKFQKTAAHIVSIKRNNVLDTLKSQLYSASSNDP